MWHDLKVGLGLAPLPLMAALRIRGSLDLAALESALNQLRTRHEVLRTFFDGSSGAPSQVVLAPGYEPLHFSDLRGGAEPGSYDCLWDQVRSEPWPAGEPPLFRARLARLADEDHVCIVAAHPLIFDAGSFAILLDELTVLYGDAVHQRPWTLPALRIQYPDFAVWQTEGLADPAYQDQLNYWIDRIAAIQPLQGEKPASRAARNGHAAVSRNLRLGPTERQALTRLAKAEGVSLSTVLLTAIAANLPAEVPLLLAVSGRHKGALEAMIGPLGNQLLLTPELAGSSGFPAALRRVHATLEEALAHQDVPLGEVLRHTGTDADALAGCVALTIHDQDPLPHAVEGLELDWEKIFTSPSQAAIEIHVRLVGGGVEIEFDEAPLAEHSIRAEELSRTVGATLAQAGAGMSDPAAPAFAGDAAAQAPPAAELPEEPALFETVAAVWRHVLGVSQVNPADDFFELGGHSLLAIRIVTRLENELGVEIPLSSILENSTLREFVSCISVVTQAPSHSQPAAPTGIRQPQASPAPGAMRVDRGADGSRSIFPMSYAQHQMWVINQLEADVRAYNMAYAWRLRGSLELSTLQSSLDELVRRHESLRTIFQLTDGEPAQIVLPPGKAALEVIDLEARSERLREAVFQETALERLEAQIDLATGPVCRFHLFRFGPRDHSLVLAIHHIAFDEASAAILIRDLVAIYSARMSNTDSNLAELPFQYADFSVMQRRQMESSELKQQIAYWRKKLADAPASFEIPTDHARRPERSYAGAILSEIFPPELLRRLEAIGRQQGVTLFMILMAAFDALLYRYTGQEDVVIGSPITGRHKNAAEDIIGVFVNTLILRSDLSGNPTFRELLKRTRRMATEAYDNSDVPFAQLVKELGIEIDISRNPLFQIMFIEQDKWVSRLEAGDLEVTRDQIEATRSTKFDLTTYVREQEDGLRVTLEYNSDLFEKATIERMMAHYRTILESVAENIDQQIAYLPVLTPAEQQEILVEWNSTSADYALNTLRLTDLIAAQVERTPRNVAVVFDHEQLTYAELDEYTNQLANYLRERGVGPETLVGVCTHRSLEMVVALIGILKAGGAYVPLDPAYPHDRLSFMLEDSRLKILLTQEALAGNWADANVESICLDRDWPEIAKASTARLESGATPDNVAYVIYTSGSTGLPKGVEVTHRNLVNFVSAMIAEPGITAQDTLLSVTTISFDIAGLEIYVPLAVGARVVIANGETVMDGNLLIQKLKETNATVMQATPVTWRLMVESGWKGKSDLKILCGGEALPSDLAEALLARCGSLWNMYGPTETTIWSTAQQIRPQMESILIGRPIANTQVYVLSPEMRPVPMGVIGELYIGGDGVARGYLNREALTAERFVENPFRRGERIYRTGDFVRFRANGAIEYLGRADQQVKIRGHRIELGEIEARLRQHPTVRQAVVMVREDVPGSKQIVGYVVGEHYSTPVARDLAQFLGGQLPPYMVPTRFVMLDSMPLTPNGKINRKALPAPSRAVVEETATVVGPRSATEKSLVEIWSEVLGVQPIGVTDNFFELGGHSIEAVKLFARITKAFGVKLSLNTLLNSPTIEQLAVTIDTPSSNSAPHRLVPIQPHGSRTPLFWIPGGRAISVLAFRDISMMFGQDQPAYGLESRLPVAGEAFLTVPERAKQYIDLIRTRQPHGPYQLAGFCMGGMVAFEMAQQLRALGEEVSLLALLQANVPGYPEGRYRRFKTRNQRRLYQLRTMVEFVAVRVAPRFLGVTRETKQNVLDRVTKLVMGWVGTSSEVPDETQTENLRVMYPYRPHMYAGAAQVFLAEDCYESAGITPELDGRRAWNKLVTGGCDIHVVPGDHHTMLSPPHAKKLADLLAGYMRTDAQRSL
jgi:amino acid adenylation domain-containing protein